MRHPKDGGSGVGQGIRGRESRIRGPGSAPSRRRVAAGSLIRSARGLPRAAG
ncbi:hypothetical protein D516_2627 [Rhodobacter sp. AKP1]|nr:hypothetical protein D516_2627 [Rhodobacter sp. AKP1]